MWAQGALTLANFAAFGLYHQRRMPYHAQFQNQLESFLFACSALMIALALAYTFPPKPIFALEVALTSILIISVASVGAAQCWDYLRSRWRRVVRCLLCRPAGSDSRQKQKRSRRRNRCVTHVEFSTSVEGSERSVGWEGSVRTWDSVAASEESSWCKIAIGHDQPHASAPAGRALSVYVRDSSVRQSTVQDRASATNRSSTQARGSQRRSHRTSGDSVGLAEGSVLAEGSMLADETSVITEEGEDEELCLDEDALETALTVPKPDPNALFLGFNLAEMADHAAPPRPPEPPPELGACAAGVTAWRQRARHAMSVTVQDSPCRGGGPGARPSVGPNSASRSSKCEERLNRARAARNSCENRLTRAQQAAAAGSVRAQQALARWQAAGVAAQTEVASQESAAEDGPPRSLADVATLAMLGAGNSGSDGVQIGCGLGEGSVQASVAEDETEEEGRHEDAHADAEASDQIENLILAYEEASLSSDAAACEVNGSATSSIEHRHHDAGSMDEAEAQALHFLAEMHAAENPYDEDGEDDEGEDAVQVAQANARITHDECVATEPRDVPPRRLSLKPPPLTEDAEPPTSVHPSIASIMQRLAQGGNSRTRSSGGLDAIASADAGYVSPRSRRAANGTAAISPLPVAEEPTAAGGSIRYASCARQQWEARDRQLRTSQHLTPSAAAVLDETERTSNHSESGAPALAHATSRTLRPGSLLRRGSSRYQTVSKDDSAFLVE